jgi:subtilisin family serine protease
MEKPIVRASRRGIELAAPLPVVYLGLLLLLTGLVTSGCAHAERPAVHAPHEVGAVGRAVRPLGTSVPALAAAPASSVPTRETTTASTDVFAPRERPGPDGLMLRERVIRVDDRRHPLRQIREFLVLDAAGKQVVKRIEESVADHILVTCRPGSDGNVVLAAAALPPGAQVARRIGMTRTWIVNIAIRDHDSRELAMAQLGRLPGVLGVGLDRIVRIAAMPDDPLLGDCWGLDNTGQSGGTPGADIGAAVAWDYSTGSHAVRVGVIDTGIDYNHPDLMANIWNNPGETGLDASGRDRRTNGVDDDGNGFVDDWHGWDFANGDNDPMDDHGHGTHCAGTIGAEGGNHAGVAGVCWQVSLVPLKFLHGNGSGATSDAVAAIDYARSLGLPITSNSWGSLYPDPVLDEAIRVATGAGMLFVAAAGNNGTDDDVAPFYPAATPLAGIISVAATDRNDALAAFSCFGRLSVDLGAPGVDIMSCYPGGRYRTMSGTSMATPHVAGACALIMALDSGLTGAQVKASLLANAHRLPGLVGKSVSGGRLDLASCVLARSGPLPRLLDCTISDAPVDGATGNGNGIWEPGETVAIRVHVGNSGTAAASGVHAELDGLDPTGVATVVRGGASFGSLAAGADGYGDLPLLVAIHGDAPVPVVITCPIGITATSPGPTVGGSCAIAVHAFYTISGHVYSATAGGDVPAPGATVSWSGAAAGSAVTDGGGSYTFSVPDGNYTIQATIPGVGAGAPVQVTVPPQRTLDFHIGLPGIGISPALLAIAAPQGGTGHAPLTVTNQRSWPLTVSLKPAVGRLGAVSGLWHQSSGKRVVGSSSWYYGIEAQGNYDTGTRTSGALVFEDVQIPAGGASLIWWSNRQCDGLATDDLCLVQVSTDRGGHWQPIQEMDDNTGTWTFQWGSLYGYAGQRVWIRFWFDSVDATDNAHQGWYVDGICLRGGAYDRPLGCLVPDPETVVIPGGSSATFDVVASAEDLFSVGPRSELLHLTVDDGSSSETDIPVTIDVQPAALLQCAISTFFDFTADADGDWHPEAGERVQPAILISNLGMGEIHDATAVLSFTDPLITVANGTIAIPLIGAYTNISVGYPIEVAIDPSCTTNRLVTGTFHVTDRSGGDWTSAVSFRILPTWSLSGRVTAADGVTAIAGASVGNGRMGAVTGSDGRYRIDGLHPGNHLFIASKAGYGSMQAGSSDTVHADLDFRLGQPRVNIGTQTLHATVVQGASVVIHQPIRNVGDGVLEWCQTLPVDAYDMDSSRDPDGPVPAWRDIAASGRELRELQQVSSSMGPYPFGFPFPFFDGIRTETRVAPYGYLHFSATTATGSNRALPSPAAPPDIIAWLWQLQWFLDLGSAHAELVDPDTWIMQFDSAYLAGVPSLVTSQVVLSRDGTITCQYHTLANGSSCTVGIQDASQTRGAMFTDDGSGLGDGVAVRFRPHPTWLRLANLRGAVAAGGSGDAAVLVDTTGLAIGSYQRTLFLTSNAVDEPAIVVTVQLDVVPFPVDDLEISGAGVLIADGDVVPDISDASDFAAVPIGGSAEHVFTIRNCGTTLLQLTGSPLVEISGAGAANFTVISQPDHEIPSGMTSSFTIRYAPAGRGTSEATVSVANSVPGKMPYDFAVVGTFSNTPPAATADAYATSADMALIQPSPGVLGNDSDVDGDALTAVLAAAAAHGVVVLAADGGFTYTPQHGFVGVDHFSYRASDGGSLSSPVVVSITVLEPGNTPPAATADAYATSADMALIQPSPGVLGNDSDADGDALTAVLATASTHGVVVLAADGGFTYTPQHGFAGVDHFSYRASDGGSLSDTVVVSITVSTTADHGAAPAAAHGGGQCGAGVWLALLVAFGLCCSSRSRRGSAIRAAGHESEE